MAQNADSNNVSFEVQASVEFGSLMTSLWTQWSRYLASCSGLMISNLGAGRRAVAGRRTISIPCTCRRELLAEVPRDSAQANLMFCRPAQESQRLGRIINVYSVGVSDLRDETEFGPALRPGRIYTPFGEYAALQPTLVACSPI